MSAHARQAENRKIAIDACGTEAQLQAVFNYIDTSVALEIQVSAFISEQRLNVNEKKERRDCETTVSR